MKCGEIGSVNWSEGNNRKLRGTEIEFLFSFRALWIIKYGVGKFSRKTYKNTYSKVFFNNKRTRFIHVSFCFYLKCFHMPKRNIIVKLKHLHGNFEYLIWKHFEKLLVYKFRENFLWCFRYTLSLPSIICKVKGDLNPKLCCTVTAKDKKITLTL